MGARAQPPQSGNRSKGRNMVFAALTRGLLAAAVLIVAAASSGRAQSVADFYKGKTVDLYIGYSVGGAYDLYARQLARHIGKHIPGNPTVLPKNMEGAGSLRLANWLYNVGPKDGTAFGIIGRGTGFDPLLGNKAAQFDATKFTWIGSANNEVSICVAWTHQRHHQIRGHADQGAGRRRHQHLGRHRPVPARSSTACSAPR